MEWHYNDSIYDGNDIENLEGFVYLIENSLNHKKYIGKKHFWTRQKSKKTNRKVTKESNWKNYYGSCEELTKDVKELGKANFKRTILILCSYKKQMSFWEEKYQWESNVLLEEGWYNTCIGGKFFVRENYIYKIPFKEITTKNENWRKIASQRMQGELNPAKSESSRKKISEKKKGKNHHQYGKPISDDHNKKLHIASKKAHQKPVKYKNEIYEDGVTLRKTLNLNIGKYYKMMKLGEIKFS